MPMLAAKLRLLDVDDVEALARSALHDRLRRWRITLRASQYDDALSYLIVLCWELSERYDPARDRAREKGLRPSFAGYAGTILRLRVADWLRSEFGRSGGKADVVVLSLDTGIKLDANANGGDREPSGLVDDLVDPTPGPEDRVLGRVRL